MLQKKTLGIFGVTNVLAFLLIRLKKRELIKNYAVSK